MSSICFYFQVHQPYRLREYRIFDVGQSSSYFDEHFEHRQSNEEIFNKVAKNCYIPTTKMLLKLLKKHEELTLSFSFSGIFLEQAEQYNPTVLDLFKQLVKTGKVELFAETYYHSLAFHYSEEEFISQIQLHQAKVKDIFGVEPITFRNTELIYNNDIALIAESLGFEAILAEGAERILDGQSPNFVYQPKGATNIKLLLKNYKLSDDIAFRFSDKSWREHPLSVEKYVDWINNHYQGDEVINLFMDYETFGEHHGEHTGIFEFMEALPKGLIESGHTFTTPATAAQELQVHGTIDAPEHVSWADEDRDLSAWLSNDMQRDAASKLFDLEQKVKELQDKKLLEDWRRLQTSDHFYYMCTKYFADGDVHKYFSPFESPYEAFIAYMNVLQDMSLRVYAKEIPNSKS